MMILPQIEAATSHGVGWWSHSQDVHFHGEEEEGEGEGNQKIWNTHPWNPSWNCVSLQQLSIDIFFSSAISSLQQNLVIIGLYLHKTFQLQRDCSSCKEFKHKIGIEKATGRTSATRKNQKDLQQNFAVVELARKQEEEEEEDDNKETKEEEEYCYYLLRRCTLLLVAFLRSLHGTDSRKQRHSLQ